MATNPDELDDRLQVRMNSELKENVENQIKSAGLDHATLVRMLYKRIEAEGAIPFRVRLLNEETREAFETDDIEVTELDSEEDVEEHLENFVDDI
jgi:addiction module RelB/DinJ family antitoxin